MVADVADNRLEMTKPFGPDVLINPEKQDLDRAVMEHTGGRGADVIITSVPSHQVQQQAVHLAAKFGRINLFGGLPKGRSEVTLDTNVIHYNQLTVTGVSGASPSDYEMAVRLIVHGKVDVASLVSKKFRVEEASEALSYAMSGKGLKTLFVF
jgi:threonine dehydrogenase-like Zn-dependent dehydrogenase